MRSKRTSVARQVALILILISVPLALVGCGDQMAKMEANQLDLEAMIAANARQIATVSSQIHNSQSKLNESLAQLDENTKTINTKVLAIQDQQGRLQGALVSSERNLTKQITQLEQNQAQLRDGVSQVADISQKTNAAVSAVARDQATLHNVVQGHKRDLDGRITAIAKSQEETHAGIAKLSQADSDLGDRIAAVSQKQDTLQKLATENQNRLASQVATLAQNQEAGIANLRQADKDLAGKLAAMTQEQQALQELTTHNYANLTGQITSVAKTQERTQAGLANLQQADQDLAGKIATVTTEQQALRELTATNQQQLTGQIAAVAKAQEETHSGIAGLQQADQDINGKIVAMSQAQQAMQKLTASNQQQLSDKIATVSQEQQTLRELAASNHTALADQIATVTATQQKTQDGIASLQQADGELGEKITAVSQEQLALKELTTGNHAKLTSHIASVAKNQEMTQIGIVQLQNTDQEIAGQIAKMSQDQLALQELTSNNHKAVTDQVASLSNGQTQLRNDVGQLRTQTNAVATDLTAVTKEQAAIRETLKTASITLAEKLALVETNQNDIQSLIDRVANTADQTSQDVATLATTQAAIQQRQKANHEALNNQLAVVTKSQQYATEHLDAITTTAVQLTLDVLSLEEAQTNIEQAVRNNHTASTSALASLSEGQQTMQGRLAKVATSTEAVARDVVALGENQSKLEQTFEGTRNEFATSLEVITKDQKTMQGQLDKVVTAGEQLTRQIDTLDKKQTKIEQTIEGTRSEFTAALGSVTQGQWAVQGNLDKVTAKTDEVANEMKVLSENQGKLEQEIVGARGEFTTALGTLNESQETMQGQLTDVTTANEKVAVEVAQLDKSHAELTNTVKTNREELVTKLNEIALGQQQWLTRFDATEAKVEAMTTSLTSLEQRVTKLQGTLQNSLADLSTLLDAKAQERAAFETTVRQDVQGVTDSVADLADVQAGLAEDIQQVKTDTQSQTKDILSALKKLQQKTETKAVESVEQIEASKAELQEIMLP